MCPVFLPFEKMQPFHAEQYAFLSESANEDVMQPYGCHHDPVVSWSQLMATPWRLAHTWMTQPADCDPCLTLVKAWRDQFSRGAGCAERGEGAGFPPYYNPSILFFYSARGETFATHLFSSGQGGLLGAGVFAELGTRGSLD